MKLLGIEITRGSIETRMANYTDMILQHWRSSRSDTNDGDVSATAAVEFALMRYALGFASAAVTPPIPALNAEYRSAIPRDLMLTGNHLAAIFVSPDRGIRLVRPSSYDIQGGPDPASWRYHLTLAGPNGGDSVYATSDQVIHVRINASPIEPWRGRSPLENASLTSLALARTEERLADEMNAQSVNLVSRPHSPNSEDTNVQDHLKAAKGRTIVVQNAVQGGWRDSGAGKWEMIRIGPNPPSSFNDLRGSTSADILSAMGIPSGLYQSREGSVSREAYRQLLSSAIAPLATLVAEELTTKLNMPIAFTFHGLAAADVSAKARAFGSLLNVKNTDGSPFLSKEEALIYSGLDT